MTIKEMEEHSGMVRANIRYYEAEGLLTLVRASNGFWDWEVNSSLEVQEESGVRGALFWYISDGWPVIS